MWKFLSALGLAACAVGQDILGSTGCTRPVCVFSNEYLRFGSGAETSVNNWGLFVQPWYYSQLSSTWYKLTFNMYPLDTAIGFGTGSSHWSGATITDLYSLTPTASSTDYSNYIVNASDASKTVGFGKIVAVRSFLVLGQLITLQNTFSLGQYDRFVRITNVLINNSTAPLQNTYVWVGTRDDFVGVTDVNTKTRGNLISGNFTPVTANNDTSRAIMITNTNEGVLFYSETPGVMTAYASCCSFSNSYNTYPLTLAPATPSPTDGSYAAVLPLGTVGVNSSASITWYYAAGVISSLASVAQTVAIAQVADSAPVATVSAYPVAVFPTFTSEPTVTPTSTVSSTASGTPTATSTVSNSPSGTPTSTESPTGTPTATSTVSNSPTGTDSSTQSMSSTSTLTISSTPTETPTQTATPPYTVSPTSSGTSTPSSTVSSSPTGTPTPTESPSVTQTSSPSPTAAVTPSPTSTYTSTPSSTPSLLVRIVLVAAEQTNATFAQPTIGIDSLIYIYTFVPINVLILLGCCCAGAAGLYYCRRKKSKEEVDTNTIHVREVDEVRLTEEVKKKEGDTLSV